ncbi:MAG: zinc ribbon domain-containing protein [bacterium]
MSIRFNCQFCDAVMKIPDTMAGSQGTCPTCKRTIFAPMVSSIEAPTNQPQFNAQPNPAINTEAAVTPSMPSSNPYVSQNISQQPSQLSNNVQNATPAVPAPSFCSKCGNQLVPGGRVCTSCGTPIVNASSASPYSQQVIQQPLVQPGNIIPGESATMPSSNYCRKCGNILVPGGRVCTNCGTPAATSGMPASVPSVSQTRQYYDNNFWQTFITFISNPFSGIKLAVDNLEANKVSGAGLIFGLSFIVLTILGLLIFSQSPGELKSFLSSIGVTSKNIISSVFFLGLFTFGCLLVTVAIVRALWRGEGTFGEVVFFTGATLIPLGLSIFIGALLSYISPALVFFVLPFTISHTFLTIHGGLRVLFNIAEEKITYAMPVLLIGWAVFEILFLAIFSAILLAGAINRSFGN